MSRGFPQTLADLMGWIMRESVILLKEWGKRTPTWTDYRTSVGVSSNRMAIPERACSTRG
jgi:hypothetical protein